MRYEIVLAPEAAGAFRSLTAYQRAEVRDALERHLRYEPTRISKSRIRRLRGFSQPQCRLRIGEVRVFYDVTGESVEVLAIVTKAEAAGRLAEHGTPATPGGTGRGER
jgi:mRNA-degrading endonuclease RelE of RelBE toxin-antitoxin system